MFLIFILAFPLYLSVMPFYDTRLPDNSSDNKVQKFKFSLKLPSELFLICDILM